MAGPNLVSLQQCITRLRGNAKQNKNGRPPSSFWHS